MIALYISTGTRRRRAAVAIVLAALVAFGLGLLIGPTAVGLLNDRVFLAPDGVRYSLTTVALLGALTLTLYFATGRRAYGAAVRELEAAQMLRANQA